MSCSAEFLLCRCRYDTLNHRGLSPLMVAALRNDETAIQTLLDCGANPNVEVPAMGHPMYPAIHPETQHWTALTFAACRGNYQALRVLLERGAKIEGGARLSEDKCTCTPLQVASGTGCIENVSILLAHGASSFLSTKQNSMSFSGKAQQGCYSAISVATAHGQRLTLRKLLSHPFVPEKQRDVLSLEEMLAEGDNNARSSHERQNEVPPTLSKAQIRALQEAMYHSAENNYLGMSELLPCAHLIFRNLHRVIDSTFCASLRSFFTFFHTKAKRKKDNFQFFSPAVAMKIFHSIETESTGSRRKPSPITFRGELLERKSRLKFLQDFPPTKSPFADVSVMQKREKFHHE